MRAVMRPVWTAGLSVCVPPDTREVDTPQHVNRKTATGIQSVQEVVTEKATA